MLDFKNLKNRPRILKYPNRFFDIRIAEYAFKYLGLSTFSRDDIKT